MAYFGAKVLHPATIYPALKEKIPVWVLNSKNPNDPGTEITYDSSAIAGVRGIAFKRGITMVNIHSGRMLGAHGFLKTVFDIFAKYRLSVDLISTSEVNISLTLDPNSDMDALNKAKAELSAFSEVEIAADQAMISVIGGGIRATPGLAAKIFTEIKDINVQMISMGASELNLSFVVNSSSAADAVQRLHKALIQ
jgi:aspartate kinase